MKLEFSRQIFGKSSNINILGARGGVVVNHYATNRQVAGWIPDGVIGIFQ
jgi:hypothetical protein